jgi:hypothetical protein
MDSYQPPPDFRDKMAFEGTHLRLKIGLLEAG